MRWLAAAILVVLLAAALLVSRAGVRTVPTVTELQEQVDAGNYQVAKTLIESLTAANLPQSHQQKLYRLAADVAVAEQRHDNALTLYRMVPADGSEHGTHSALARVEICQREGLFAEAVSVLESLISLAPQQLPASVRSEAHRVLAEVYAMSGLRFRAWEHLQTLLDDGSSDFRVLAAVADPRYVAYIPFEARQKLRHHQDPLLAMGSALLYADQGHAQDAAEFTMLFSASRGWDAEEYVCAGRVAYQADGPGALQKWFARRADGRRLDARRSDGRPSEERQPALDNHVETLPEYWYLSGVAAADRGDHAGAVRCFLECLSLWPDYTPAVSAIAKSAAAIGETELAETASERSALLDALAAAASPVGREEGTCRDIEILARTCLKLGRVAEARGWCEYALRESTCGADPWISEVRASTDQFPPTTPWITPRDPITSIAEQSKFPLPSNPVDVTPQAAELESSATRLSFRDDATSVGLQFRGRRDPEKLHTMRYFTGTGVGVIDYDRDRRPDLFFSQNTDPASASANPFPAPTSQLYRNRRGQTYREITEQAVARANGFGQGVAAGDVDGDGFPDLYIGNDGPNELLINNGDGTFSSSVVKPSDRESSPWTTSVAIADLDQDGTADLFDANYLTGDDVRTRICGSETRPRSCPPRSFAPAANMIHLGVGSNSGARASGGPDFQSHVTQLPADGNSLGVVVANLDRQPGLDVFVANDLTPNHLLTYTGATNGWVDNAPFRGLAYNAHGVSQACMGVACTDINDDGLTDLLVTNFFNERNAFYTSDSAGFYNEVIDQYKLGDDSYNLLGFGTQFVDVDNDGDDDLIVANGHIFDSADAQEPYRMRPTLYEHVGSTFVSVPPAQAGAFFAKPQLGRAVARLDWNGDARDDIVMTDLTEPAVLLTNTTPPIRKTFRVSLTAMAGQRDAIGAAVTLQAGTWTARRELTGGDGYLCTNERVLSFAIPQDVSATMLTVQWRPEVTNAYDVDSAVGDFAIVEGATSGPTRLP